VAHRLVFDERGAEGLAPLRPGQCLVEAGLRKAECARGQADAFAV
jgi:hypothetical protein